DEQISFPDICSVQRRVRRGIPFDGLYIEVIAGILEFICILIDNRNAVAFESQQFCEVKTHVSCACNNDSHEVRLFIAVANIRHQTLMERNNAVKLEYATELPDSH